MCVRELEEEAGVAGKPIKSLGTLDGRAGADDAEITYYLAEAANQGEDREGRQRRWVPAAEAVELLSSDDLRLLLAKAAKEIGKPRGLLARWLRRFT